MPPGEVPATRAGRPTEATIDVGAFLSNLALARRLGGRAVMAVVKADAYGHGAVELARAAALAGAEFLGVATVGEARQLREAGIEAPIMILSEPPPSEASETVRLRALPVVYSRPFAEALAAAARDCGERAALHLKVDTGMGRVGVLPGEAPGFARFLAALAPLRVEGLLTHMAEADLLESPFTAEQLRIFASLGERLNPLLPELRHVHAANSALVMRGEAPGNLLRPGIMLYGSPPGPSFPHSGELRPVMRLASALSYLKRVPAGTPLSYGRTFVTARESLIATLPVGYADGYPRLLSNQAEVLVRGRRVPLVGRVCMDMILVDVTGLEGVAPGEEAVLLGRQGQEEITAEELAERLGTISYEVYCNFGRPIARRYLAAGGGEAP